MKPNTVLHTKGSQQAAGDIGASLVLSGQESTCQCTRPEVDPYVSKIPWRRKWQPTPLAWRIPWTELAGYSPQGYKESDTTEQLHFNRKKSGTTNLSNHSKHSLPIYMDIISKFYCGLPKTLTFTTYFQNLKSC